MTLVLLAKEGEKTKEYSIIYIQRDNLIRLDDENSDPGCKLGHLDLLMAGVGDGHQGQPLLTLIIYIIIYYAIWFFFRTQDHSPLDFSIVIYIYSYIYICIYIKVHTLYSH